MKRVFDAVEQRSSVLVDHLTRYFPPAAGQRAMRTVTERFSRCGGCGGMCDLKQSAGQYAHRALYCDRCQKSLSLPGKHALAAHEHTCPICQYQVILVTNESKQSSHTICPHCFNHTPTSEIEEAARTVGTGMRCFQCVRTDCALASKSVGQRRHEHAARGPHAAREGGRRATLHHSHTSRTSPDASVTICVCRYRNRSRQSNDPVRACDVCGEMMMMRSFPSGGRYTRTQAATRVGASDHDRSRNSSHLLLSSVGRSAPRLAALYLGCAGFPQCSNKVTFTCRDAQITTNECEQCGQNKQKKRRMEEGRNQRTGDSDLSLSLSPSCHLVGPTGFHARLVSFTFSPGQAPPHIANPLVACVGGCDEEVNELFGFTVRRAPHAARQAQHPRAASAGPPPAAPTVARATTAAASHIHRANQFPSRSGHVVDGPTGFINSDRISPIDAEWRAGTGASAARRKPPDAAAAGAKKSDRSRTSRASTARGSAAARAVYLDEGEGGTSFTSQYRQQQQQQARADEWTPTTAQTTTMTSAVAHARANRNSAAYASDPTPSWHWSANANAGGGSGGGGSYGANSSGGSTDLSSVTCYRCHQVGHFANACPQLPSGAASSSSSYAPRAARGARRTAGGGRDARSGTASGGGGGGASGDCFHCGQPGHWSANCPNKR